MAEESEAKSKMQSRKFIVWLVWLVITFIYTVITIIQLLKTGSIPDNVTEIWKMIIQYFFVISCIYLGVNLVQKGVLAAKDVLNNISLDETEEEK